MSTRLVLLGLLREGSLHGYELKRLIEEHMGDWTNIAFGSIYFALGKLRDEGFVAEAEPERSGRRPAKIVYKITEAGREEFLRLLRDLFASRSKTRYEIDLAIAFLDALPTEELIEQFRNRVLSLESAFAGLKKHEAEQLSDPGVPASARLIFSHSGAHLEAEIAWTKSVLAELENGRL